MKLGISYETRETFQKTVSNIDGYIVIWIDIEFQWLKESSIAIQSRRFVKWKF